MDKVPEKKLVAVNFCHALRSLLDFLTHRKMGPIGCPEASVTNYYCTLHNTDLTYRFGDAGLSLTMHGLVRHFMWVLRQPHTFKDRI